MVGFTHDDTEKDLDYMVNKCLNVRVYEDKERNRNWDLSVKALNLEILVISQFTLYSKLKGRQQAITCKLIGTLESLPDGLELK